jgi:hypothetical protein
LTVDRVPAPMRTVFNRRLEALGYEFSSGAYWRRVPDGTAIIDVTADKWSARAPVARITANLAFYSSRLGRVFGPPGYVGSALDQVHWYRGIGAIREADPPDIPDRGIWVVERADPAGIESAASEIVDLASSILTSYAADEGIRDLWLEEGDFFWEPQKQAAYLAVLLAALGPAEALPPLVDRLQHFADDGSRLAQQALDALRGEAQRQL